MLQSPFSYYRGTAAVMAADLRDAPTTDLDVVSCGDAHISNFGFYASPERELVFDLNDFDEGGIAPWEWEVRRLTASVYVGGRDIGLSEDACRDAVFDAANTYRKSCDDSSACLRPIATTPESTPPRSPANSALPANARCARR